MPTLLGAQSSTFDLETIPGIGSGGGSSSGHLEGAKARYVNSHQIHLEAGEFRDAADTADIAPAAATLDLETLGTLNGLDESTLTATGTSSGGTDLTLTSSLWAQTVMTNTVRTLTGTWTAGGSTMTCDGGDGRALEQLRAGDVVRSATVGGVLVLSVTDNNTVVLNSSFPDGDPTSEAMTFYENLTIRCGTDDVRRVISANHAGTLVYGSVDFNDAGSGKAITVGGEYATCDFSPFAVQGSGGDGYVLSTQRTRPYSVANYRVSWRRVPCGIKNDGSGNLFKFDDRFGGRVRYIAWDTSGDHPIVGGDITSVTWTAAPTLVGCPGTASLIVMKVAIFNTTFDATPGYLVAQMRTAWSAAGPDGEVGCGCGTTSDTAGTNYSSGVPIAVGSAGGIQFKLAAGGTTNIGGGGVYIDALGWWEVG